MVRPIAVGLLILGVVLPLKPALAELGGMLNLEGPVPTTATDAGKQSGMELSSYSWERGDWGPGGRGNKFLAFGRVGRPDKGPGVLAVVTPAAMAENPLRALCGKKDPIKEIAFRSPDIDDPTRQTLQIFTLKDVTVSDCVHATGAPGEVFHLNFTEIKELTPPHSTCEFGKDC